MGTRDKGTSADDLYKQYKESEQGKALARGKDYCKPFVHSVCIRGVRYVTENKRERNHMRSESESDGPDEEEETRKKKFLREAEKQEKMAAIEAKYCARVPGATAVPDSLRLG